MREFITSVFMVPVLLLAVFALIPTSTMAASPQHVPHFFLKSISSSSTASLKKVRAGNNLIYNGGPVMAGTANVYAIFWEPNNNVQSGYNSLI